MRAKGARSVRHSRLGDDARPVLRIENAALLGVGDKVDDLAEVLSSDGAVASLRPGATGLGTRGRLLGRRLWARHVCLRFLPLGRLFWQRLLATPPM
jgi:hypothetical protein